jgi:hypothetical protein
MFFKFSPEDVIHTKIETFPQQTVYLYGDQFTGSVYLERKYLNSTLLNRQVNGYSEKLGGFTTSSYPFTASIDFKNAVSGGTNNQLYRTILRLYNYYSILSTNYTSSFNNAQCKNFRVMTVPEVYYDKEICSRNIFCF